MNQGYLKELLEAVDAGDYTNLTRLKIRLCKKHGLKEMPTNIEVLLNAPDSLYHKLRKLQTKPTRGLSGVSVIAVMTKPHRCPHGKCTTCPGGPESCFGEVPQSYTGREPATRRAIRNRYDPYLQIMNRLEQYVVTGHPVDKIELIIMGGTFPAMNTRYQDCFIRDCFKALNDFSSMFFRGGELDIRRLKEFYRLPGRVDDPQRSRKIHTSLRKLKKSRATDLGKEHRLNEKGHVRCVSLVVETRPDHAKEEHALRMLGQGVTKVELGCQSVYDKALEAIERGHTVKDTIDATKTLKDLGFKINYHMMPGLPGVTPVEDLEGLKRLYSDPDFRPDMLKLYPCMVLKGTKLYSDWKKGKYTPLDTQRAAELITEFKKHVPRYVRIMRVQRDIPTFMTEAGVDRTNLRQYISKLMLEKGVKCNCIRCREVGRSRPGGRVDFRSLEYNASGGTEFFISAETKDSLYGFCRLRFPAKILHPVVTAKSAVVRELHVYGDTASIGKEGRFQHKGLGKKLLLHAEALAKQSGLDKMIVISGVGVREYYRRRGYKKEGPYMVKRLTS